MELITLHYLALACAAVLPCLAVSIAQGKATKAMLTALDEQPSQERALRSSFLLGLAFLETIGVLSLFVIIVFFQQTPVTFFQLYARVGSMLAITVPAIALVYHNGTAVGALLLSIARQPVLAQSYMTFLVVSQSLAQTPFIFAALFALLIERSLAGVVTVEGGLSLLACGLVIALGSVGPCLGIGRFIAQASGSISTYRHAYAKLFTFTFVSLALIETPFILALSCAFFLLQAPAVTVVGAYKLLCSAVALGLCNMGVGLGSSYTASRAYQAMALCPELAAPIMRSSLVTQAFIETGAIYGLLVALMLALT